jgi:hypothetical protein
MAQQTLADVLGPPKEEAETLRWEAVVPIGTNPFMLLELFQFALMGAGVSAVSLGFGVWAGEGGITMGDVVGALQISGMILAGVIAGFIVMAVVFFGNRYFAVYRIEEDGVYYESSRGSDGSGAWFTLRARPYPVTGDIKADRTCSRHLPWEKADRFQEIASMRVIMLRRGRRHLLRLYMPDAATHERVTAVLPQRLRRV